MCIEQLKRMVNMAAIMIATSMVVITGAFSSAKIMHLSMSWIESAVLFESANSVAKIICVIVRMMFELMK
jgi:hypothetical protein